MGKRWDPSQLVALLTELGFKNFLNGRSAIGRSTAGRQNQPDGGCFSTPISPAGKQTSFGFHRLGNRRCPD